MPPQPKEEKKRELRSILVNCTKMDVRVNNIMSRARPVVIMHYS